MVYFMVRLNESVKVFKGKFIDSTTFIGPDGKPYKLIPSVVNEPELSDEDKEKLSGNSTPPMSGGFDWQGETEKKKAKVTTNIQTPDPSKTFIDDETGIAYVWDEKADRFVEIPGGKI